MADTRERCPVCGEVPRSDLLQRFTDRALRIYTHGPAIDPRRREPLRFTVQHIVTTDKITGRQTVSSESAS